MAFCINCGAKNKEENLFCDQCGTRIKWPEETNESPDEKIENVEDSSKPLTEPENAPVTLPVIPIENEQIKTRKDKKQKKKFSIGKLISIIIAVLVIIGFGTYFVMKDKIYNPMNQIEDMNSAYKEGNKYDFYKHFTIPEGTVGNADLFMNFIEEIGWEEVGKQLVVEIDKYKNGKSMNSIQYNGKDFIDIKTKPVFWGLFDTFEFSIVPLEVEVYSPKKGVNITIDNVSITTTNEEEYQEIGKFLPGEYKYSYSYDQGYIPIKGEGTVKIAVQDSEKNTQLDLDFNSWTEVDLYSSVEDAILYVNGKSTKKTIEEIETLSPVILNDSVELYAVGKNKDGEKIKSDRYKLTDSVIYFEFPQIQKEQEVIETKEKIIQTYQTYRYEFETANNNADFSYVSKYFVDGSQIQKDYKKFVEDHIKIDDYRYNFLSNEVTSIEEISESEYVILTKETFEYYSSDDGTILFERDKKYTIEVITDAIYFKEIKDLHTKQTKIN